ncbi:periplasmic heavy metal sensor, partial [bacterium]|nr:periplasmic heavy metal sensor [bacterium]
MRMRTWMLAVAVLIAAGLTAAAQQPRPSPGGGPQQMPPGHPSGGPRGDVMAENFFPPELIMHNQQALGLTAEQQSSIRSEMQKMMTKFTDLQWQMSSEAEKMAALVKAEHPDEKAVLAQLDKVLDIEKDVKRGQIGLMV